MSDRAAVVARHRYGVAEAGRRGTNRGIARRLWLTERTVVTHVAGILAKLGIGPDEEDHRRVRAMLAFLRHRGAPTL